MAERPEGRVLDSWDFLDIYGGKHLTGSVVLRKNSICENKHVAVLKLHKNRQVIIHLNVAIATKIDLTECLFVAKPSWNRDYPDLMTVR